MGRFEVLPAPARENFILHYTLTLDATSAALVLGLDSIKDPWACKLSVAASDSSESIERSVDLIGTFNQLIGLRVERAWESEGVTIQKGVDPLGATAMVFWRRTVEVDNSQLSRVVSKQLALNAGVKRVYANGPNTLDNLAGSGERYSVRQVEEDFARLMFDVRDV